MNRATAISKVGFSIHELSNARFYLEPSKRDQSARKLIDEALKLVDQAYTILVTPE